ncbi:MAG TPA: NifU family protein [Sulfuriferula sp.]|nr:NifU family protein [Sulfuriferula sp.]
MTDVAKSIPIKRFSAEDLAARDREMALDDTRWYSEEELDELDERDPLLAARIAQRQARLERLRPYQASGEAPPLTEAALVQVLEEARAILLRDGGDLELVEISGTVVRVRLKGACVGCPNSMRDLKNVVEKIVRRTFPQVTEVQNTY